MNRRQFLARSSALLASTAFPLAFSTPVYAQEEITLLELARAARSRPYTPNTTPLAAPFANLTYDAFRGIRPLPGQAAMLPHGEKFAYDLLPPGLYFPDPIAFDQITSQGVREIAFSPKLFSYEPRYFDSIPDTSPGAGFTGLRLRYPVNAADRLDEVLVMQGASYFRAIGEAMVYGLSARTVAVGTGGGGPEEFPRFTHIRLHQAHGDSVRLEGMIDSPSLTGHIDMTLRPGSDTVMDIVTTLFPRVEIDNVGIAPLTSMYLKGPMLAAVSDDFRPRVHDSDVLVIENGAGEVLWRPIANPRGLETSVFSDDSPARFGLYQTVRSFEDFEDTEARYHDRPSAFVEPLEPWGQGGVMLVELPTGDEYLDNIVAFWRPQEPLQPGAEYRYAYRLSWTREAPGTAGLPTILQSRSGEEHDQPGRRRFVVDVASSAVDAVPLISSSEGSTLTGVSAFALPDGQSTRITFLFDPGELEVAELRLSLRSEDGTPHSPVWLHRWTRARDGGV